MAHCPDRSFAGKNKALSEGSRKPKISLCTMEPAEESSWIFRHYRDFQCGLHKVLINPDNSLAGMQLQGQKEMILQRD